MFGGDFHITLKLLVFLLKAKAAAKSGGLKAGGCLRDGEMKSTQCWSSQCVCVCVCVCERERERAGERVSEYEREREMERGLWLHGSLLVPYNRHHSAKEKPRALLGIWPVTQAQAQCDPWTGDSWKKMAL